MFRNSFATGLKCAAIALILPIGAASIVTLGADPAFAERGGNGNGNANRSRGNSNRESNAETRGNNGRGAIASELKGLNAAHASPTALASASPDSMPGKLNAYRESYLAAETAERDALETKELLAALQDMTEERFLELNPTLDYATTLTSYESSYLSKSQVLSAATDTAGLSLRDLTGGRELSDGALSELHSLLGL